MLANPPSPAVAGMPVTSAALAASIVVGAALGHYAPDAGQWLASGVDHTLLVVVGLLFFGVRFGALLHGADHMTPWAISLLVLQIFAANVPIMIEHHAVFGWVLLAVFVFFALTYVLGECVSRLFHLRYPEHALLTMTLASRNAPLMLAVTMAALPGQPLIYAALVVGMLLEFPHLTFLHRLLLGARDRRLPNNATAATMSPGTD